MKKLLLISLACASFTSSAYAGGFYIGGFAGYTHLVKSSFIDKNTDSIINLSPSKIFGGKIDYEFAPNMHLELCVSSAADAKLNVGLKTKDTSETSFTQRHLHLNLIYDLNPIGEHFTPYFLFGLGGSNIKLDKFDIKKGSFLLFSAKEQNKYFKSWNVALGANLSLSDNFYLDASCKFVSIHNIEIDYQGWDSKESKMVDALIKTPLPNIQWNLGVKFKI